jgi:hypothetical protein
MGDLPLLAEPSHARAVVAFYATDRAWRAADAKLTKTSDARRALPPGSTRARITSANARYMRAAEERDRIERDLRARFEGMRQPWQMPRAEWEADLSAQAIHPTTGMPANHHAAAAWVTTKSLRKQFLRFYLGDRVLFAGTEDEYRIPASHRDVVAQAIAEGFDVPPSVRAEYPDLAEGAAA